MPGRASFLLPDRALPENEINRNQVLRTTRGVRETASALSDEIAARLSSAALLCTSKVDPFSSNNRCLLNSPSERLTDSREQPMSCASSSWVNESFTRTAPLFSCASAVHSINKRAQFFGNRIAKRDRADHCVSRMAVAAHVLCHAQAPLAVRADIPQEAPRGSQTPVAWVRTSRPSLRASHAKIAAYNPRRSPGFAIFMMILFPSLFAPGRRYTLPARPRPS